MKFSDRTSNQSTAGCWARMCGKWTVRRPTPMPRSGRPQRFAPLGVSGSTEEGEGGGEATTAAAFAPGKSLPALAAALALAGVLAALVATKVVLVHGHGAAALALAVVLARATVGAGPAAAHALAVVLALAGVLGGVGGASAPALALVMALANVLVPGLGLGRSRLLLFREHARPRRHPRHHGAHRLGEVSP